MNLNTSGRHSLSTLLVFHIILFLSAKIKCMDIASDFMDLKQPIVIFDRQQQENYFSYSIAALGSASQNGVMQSRLYFGSPKSNHSFGNFSSDSGVVIECGLKLGELNETIQCKPLVLSEYGAPTKSYKRCCYGLSSAYCDQIDEYSEGAWVGGTLSASSNTGNQIVTCGHRWQTVDSHVVPKHRRVTGMCYRLRISDVQSPTQNRLPFEILTPPLNGWEDFYNNTAYDLIWFHGEFGFSSAFDSSEGLLIGVPGYFYWNGGVVFYPNSSSATTSRKGNCPPSIKINIWPEHRHLKYFENYNHYLGYAMTSGKYFRSGESVFAVGAPRATMIGGSTHLYLIGEVKFFRAISNSIQEIQYNIVGNQLGSYFGSVLASVDVNGDGFDELIVGSPYHNMQETSVDSYDEGCAFVYTFRLINNVISYDIDQLCPSTEPGGRFGSAIANLGDINQDSYQDIAISAPMAENGAGKVYIYLGSSKMLSKRNPLIFLASEFNLVIKGFGSYLYGNVDLDGNSTPDLIIGSFVSKQALILRTRPKLEFHLTFHDNIQKFKRDDKNFTIKYCIQAKRKPTDFTGTLKIYVEVTADADRADNNARFIFADDQRTLQFSIEVGNTCNFALIPVALRKNLSPTDSKEIKFKWQLHYNETKHLPLNARIFEITDGERSESHITGSGNFCPSCPAPTTSKEIFFSIPLANDNCDQDNNPVCTSNLNVTAQFYDENDTVRTNSILGSTEKRVLKIVVKNTGETAYSPTFNMTITFPNLEIAKQVIKTLATDCSQVLNDGQNALENLKYKTTCGSSIPLHTNKTWSVSYRMHFGGLNALPKNEPLTFEIKAYPGVLPDQLAASDLQMMLVSKTDLTISGINQDETVVNFNSRGFQYFINSYLLRNDGISALSSILLEFMIPVTIKINGKYETVIQISEPKQQGLHCKSTEKFERFVEEPFQKEKSSINGSIDSLSLVSVARKRREIVKDLGDSGNGNTNVMKRPSSSPLSMKTDSTRKEIGCGSNDWECATLTCQVMYPLSQNNQLVIDLRLRIVNRFAKKLFEEEADIIVVKTDAHAKSFDSKTFTKTASSWTEFTIIKGDKLSASVIVGSAIGGLFLLLLITFGLFKCGFFRRRTMQELEAMKARVVEENTLSHQNHIPMLNKDKGDEK